MLDQIIREIIKYGKVRALLEASYEGNLGMEELMMFYDKASPEQIKALQTALNSNDAGTAMDMVQKVVGYELQAPGKSKLAAYDFDNTLATTDSVVIVHHANGAQSEINPHEWPSYKELPGDVPDFAQFNTIVNPRVIPEKFGEFKRDVEDPQTDVVVVTARQHEAASPIAQFLEDQGIETGVRIRTLASGNPRAKYLYMKNKIKKGGYKHVEFHDDATENTEVIDQLNNDPEVEAEVVTHVVPPEFYKRDRVTDIEQHLKDRGVDLSKVRVHLDRQKQIATFPLYNLSGQMVGYQRYNPNGIKKRGNDLSHRYYTYISKEGDKGKLAVWGSENIDAHNPRVYVTEGIFDAIKLMNAGLPVVAALGNNPKHLRSLFKSLNKHVIAVTDRDDAGRKLANIADEAFEVPEPYGDLGEMPQEEVNKWLESIGHGPVSGDVSVAEATETELPTIQRWIEDHHYLKKWPRGTQKKMAVHVGGKLVGAVLYGIGHHPASTSQIFQDNDGNPVMQNNQMWELTRMFLHPAAQKAVPNLASQAVARANEYIRQNAKTADGLPLKAIISYSDLKQGHEGKIYQATNALFMGTGSRGLNRYLYPLGKDQRERDALAAHIVQPLYSYPDEQGKYQEIPNPARQKAQKQPAQQTKAQPPSDRDAFLRDIMDRKVMNPLTGNKILVKTALGYEKDHPSRQQAEGMLKALAKKAGIKL